MKHLAYDSVFKVYFWEVYDIANTCHLFREKLIKCWSFCVLSYLFLSTYSTIKLNYEYEVILKNKHITYLEEILVKETGTYLQNIGRLLTSPATYLCESGFSQYRVTETKHRNKPDAHADLLLQMSPIILDLKLMCSSQHPQPSH